MSPTFLLKKAYQDFWQNRLDNSQLPERQRWLQRLTDAFENRHLELYQQEVAFLGPLATSDTHSDTNKVVLPQFEILLRLRQSMPEQPPASPMAFFPTAERYGLMRTLDRRVVQQVCETIGTKPIKAIYSINLSKTSICDPSFPDFLEEQLRRNQVNSKILAFEISESFVINTLTK
ncbi:MAG: EAL domain-containing protein, partial [Cyanobacteria bacterium J06636_28]